MKNRKRLRNTLPAVTLVTVFAGVALRQFYSFVTYKNAAGVVDLQGGQTHLWWAIGFAVAASLAAFLMFSFFLRFDRNDELHITSPPPPREMIL
jgi:hypothetical protein